MPRCPNCDHRLPWKTALWTSAGNRIVCLHCHSELQPKRWAVALMIFAVMGVMKTVSDLLPATHPPVRLIVAIGASAAAGILVLGVLPRSYRLKPPPLSMLPH